MLRSTDAGLKEVDGALTGQRAKPAVAPPATETEAAERVVALVNQARGLASRAGNAQAPPVVSRFEETLRLLYQVKLPTGVPTGPASLTDMVRMGLRDLRGSMALVRLANGSGSMEDLEEVTHFTDSLVQRTQVVVQQPAAAPAAEAPAPARRRRTPTTTGRARAPRQRKGAKEPTNPSAVVFARSMGEEMDDARVRAWAEDMATGKLSEAQFIEIGRASCRERV